jgi:rhamnulokinase
MGLWMIQSIRKEQEDAPSFDAIEQAARAADIKSRVDVENIRFLAPKSMSEEVKAACRESGQPVPRSLGELAGCVYHSLAEGYARNLDRVGTACRKKIPENLHCRAEAARTGSFAS